MKTAVALFLLKITALHDAVADHERNQRQARANQVTYTGYSTVKDECVVTIVDTETVLSTVHCAPAHDIAFLD